MSDSKWLAPKKEMDGAGENKQDVVLNTLQNNKYYYSKKLSDELHDNAMFL